MKPLLSVVTALCLLWLAGCASETELWKSTRTGHIHDIKVGDSLSPERFDVRTGDEVRWINTRSAPVKIVFVDPIKDRVSCQKGFQHGGLKGLFSDDASAIEVTTIEPNQYASLCFSAPGSYTYNARMEANTAGGEANLAGKIFVER